jgi:predicted anti-sigma-YlaC factor YlaD
MNCQEARETLEDTFGGEGTTVDRPAVETHLETCQACQEWLTRQRRAIHALEQLETLTAPPDFTQRVLTQLLDRVPESVPRPVERKERWVDRLRKGWEELTSTLAQPASRRRLAPALVAAVSLVLVLGLLSILPTGEVETTPGAVIGQVPWLALGGLMLVAAAAVLAILFWGRKK